MKDLHRNSLIMEAIALVALTHHGVSTENASYKEKRDAIATLSSNSLSVPRTTFQKILMNTGFIKWTGRLTFKLMDEKNVPKPFEQYFNVWLKTIRKEYVPILQQHAEAFSDYTSIIRLVIEQIEQDDPLIVAAIIRENLEHALEFVEYKPDHVLHFKYERIASMLTEKLLRYTVPSTFGPQKNNVDGDLLVRLDELGLISAVRVKYLIYVSQRDATMVGEAYYEQNHGYLNMPKKAAVSDIPFEVRMHNWEQAKQHFDQWKQNVGEELATFCNATGIPLDLDSPNWKSDLKLNEDILRVMIDDYSLQDTITKLLKSEETQQILNVDIPYESFSLHRRKDAEKLRCAVSSLTAILDFFVPRYEDHPEMVKYGLLEFYLLTKNLYNLEYH